MKIAFAEQAGLFAEKAVALEAYTRFRDEHPRHWLPRFSEELSRYDSELFTSAARGLTTINY
jgi:TorA maturation chaperone TorD